MAPIPFNGTPVLGPDGTIYAAAGKVTERYEGGGSALYAVWPDGRQKWICVPDLGVWGDPLLAPDGSIYIQATFRRPVEGGETLDKVVTIDPETGRVITPKRLNINAHGLIMDTKGIFYYFPDMDVHYMMAVTPDRGMVWATEELGWPVVDPHVVGPGGTVYVCAIEQGAREPPRSPDPTRPAPDLDIWPLPPGDRVWLYALGEGGRIVWRRRLSFPARLSVDSGGGPVLAWQHDGLARAFGPGGEALWAREVGPPGEAVAAFGPGGVAYLATADGRVLAVAPDGATRWAVAAPGAVTSGLRADDAGALYFGCADGAVCALDPGGALRWRHPTGGAVRGVPAVGADGAVYAGSDDGHLYALGPDGRERWRFSAGIERATSP